ncbi:hypothetical protein, partial [Lactobacillus delbrueckii]|uniref:hypothetical protein n=1 Tax=Lactobacillus delbrueckii TaxID=1584 RepID=UPI0021A45574
LTPNLTAFTGVDSQNLPDVMVSVQFILAIGGLSFFKKIEESGFVWCRPGVFIYNETIASILKIGHMVKSCE